MQLRLIFNQRFVPVASAAKHAETVADYRRTLDKFDRFLGRRARTSDLNDKTAVGFLQWLSDGSSGRAYSVRTVNNNRTYLVALWRWLHRKGYVRLGPDVDRLIEEEKPPQAFTLEELTTLLKVASQDDNAIWWRALILDIYSTGERISAALSWRREMLNSATGVLEVPGGIRKGGRQSRSYGLQPAALEATLELLDTHDWPRIFFIDCSRSTIYERLNRLLIAAGLPTTRDWKFHAIRRTFASYLARDHGEGAAQDGLGHVSRASTRRYLAPRIVGVERFDAKLPRVG